MRTRIPERDLRVLCAIGRFRMLTRPQVKRWFFRDVSEPVVTRFVKREESAGHLGVERVGGNGLQLLWLTRKGRDLLVACGTPACDLFPVTKRAAPKDFAHTVAIGDAAIWFAGRDPAPDELLPAWAIQRYLRGKLRAIPDLVALWRPTARFPGAALAVEVDLGTEPLESVFLPKLRELAPTVRAWFPDATSRIIVLTSSPRRAESVRSATGDLTVSTSAYTLAELSCPLPFATGSVT